MKMEMMLKKDELLDTKGVDTSDSPFDKVDEDEDSKAKMDMFVSGHYIINTIEYTYSEGDNQMGQKVSLLRREWPLRSNDI